MRLTDSLSAANLNPPFEENRVVPVDYRLPVASCNVFFRRLCLKTL